MSLIVTTSIVFQGKILERDEDKHLWNIEDYGPKWVAYCLHINENLPPKEKIVACLNEDGSLTEEHYKVMDAMREYYQRNQVVPLPPILSKSCRIPQRRIYKLFPAGIYAGAGKIAGVPSRSTQRQHWKM